MSSISCDDVATMLSASTPTGSSARSSCAVERAQQIQVRMLSANLLFKECMLSASTPAGSSTNGSSAIGHVSNKWSGGCSLQTRLRCKLSASMHDGSCASNTALRCRVCIEELVSGRRYA
eukprot:1160377-Pelagomonas_calceolata.AAC.5